MSQFLNGALRRLTPYTPGEQPRNQAYIKLNTNESPYPPSPGVLAALNRAEGENLRLYSDPEAVELREALAARYGVERENVFVANGSDEALSFAFLAYAADGRGVAFPDISYGFYAVFARLYGIPVRQVPLRADFRLAPEDYNHLHRTIVLANPNAPTGLALSRDEVEGIVRANPDAVVVVDEAYVDFGGESAVPLTARYPNLLVVQTFSKSRSMAGARLGYAIGDAALIQDLEAIRFSTNPYNVNRLTLRAGAAALAEQDYYDANCAAIVDTRADTKRRLEALGFTCTDSRANFLFARHPAADGGDLYRRLKERGVLVRRFDAPRIWGLYPHHHRYQGPDGRPAGTAGGTAMRTAHIARKTNETDITLTICLDGRGVSAIQSGVGFLDHMLTLLARHGRLDLELTCRGDTQVDDHHSVEDIGIALGDAVAQALGEKRGVRRYASLYLPMDEALILCAVDLSGRGGYYDALDIPAQKIGRFDTELVYEFMNAFAVHAGLTLHLRRVCGRNSHHIVEGAFKALGRALREAAAIDPEGRDEIPSTKGML